MSPEPPANFNIERDIPLLVTRMKRVCYLIPDMKYGGAWQTLKAAFYSADDTTCLPLSVRGVGSPFADSVAALHEKILVKAGSFRQSGIRDTHFLDFCRDLLAEAFDLLRRTRPTDLISLVVPEVRNATTLAGLQRALGMPVA